MNLLKYISPLTFAIILAACSDESPLEVIEDDISDIIYYAEDKADSDEGYKCSHGISDYSDSWCCSNYGYRCNYMSEAEKCSNGTSTYSNSYCCSNYGYRCSYMSESEKCYYGKSSYSDSYCCSNYGYRCSYVSSSSSAKSSSSYRYSSSSVKTEVVEAHTSKAKTMNFTLTYYEQISANWDGLSAGGIYSDGDPTVSFSIYFIASGGQSTSKTTGTLISLQDKGSWSGSKTVSFEVPIGTQDIKVCPTVVDKDALDNDNMSSGYCYTKTNIGYLSNYTTIEQSDYNSSKYELEWEWFIY